MEPINIDGIVAKPGEKAFGFLDVGTSSINTYRIPLAILNGTREGKTLCIIGGTHGTEFAGIEAVIRIIQNVDPKNMSGKILAVPVLNGPQFEHRTAFLSPIDLKNLNRVFPGDPEGTLSSRTAHVVLSKIVSKADVLCDCHGGDITENIENYIIIPKGDNEELNRINIEMAKCFPGRIIRHWKNTKGTSHMAYEMYGIPCLLPEANTPASVLERHIKYHYNGIQNLLKYMGILDGKPELSKAVINPESFAPKAKQGGIWHSKVEIGQDVDAGQELGNITDLFGNVLETFIAPKKGFIDFLRVWYSVNCGEPLVEVVFV